MAESDQKPTPDPTRLTTDQLERSEERMLREVGHVTELLLTKLEGQALECTEKFNSMHQKFSMVERQRIEQKTDTERSVDAAFSAAKEAVKEQTTASDRAIAKSENSMLEQLKQLKSTFDAAFDGMRRDIDDLKGAVGKMQSERTGRQEQITEHREGVQPFQIAVVGGLMTLFVSVLVVALNLITAA